MRETPETDALMIRINEGRTHDTIGPLQEHAEKMERERDMLRRDVLYVASTIHELTESVKRGFQCTEVESRLLIALSQVEHCLLVVADKGEVQP